MNFYTIKLGNKLVRCAVEFLALCGILKFIYPSEMRLLEIGSAFGVLWGLLQAMALSAHPTEIAKASSNPEVAEILKRSFAGRATGWLVGIAAGVIGWWVGSHPSSFSASMLLCASWAVAFLLAGDLVTLPIIFRIARLKVDTTPQARKRSRPGRS